MYKTFTTIAASLLIMVSSSAMAKDKNPSDVSILDIAKSDPSNFSILVDLLEFTGLDVVLDGPGQYTVFAPTNAAFADLIAALTTAVGPVGTEALLTDPVFVTNVLLYHVTDGRRFSNSVVNKNNMKEIETLFEGHYIYAKPSLKIMDESDLTEDAMIAPEEAPAYDLNARNGVVHVIGAVLVPAD